MSTASGFFARLNGASLDVRIKSLIKKRSWLGGLCMVLPLFGLDVIVYAIILWRTYSKISTLSAVPFKGNAFKNIIIGFLVNLIIVAVLNIVLDSLTLVPGIFALSLPLSFALGYASIYYSGVLYANMIKQVHGARAKTDAQSTVTPMFLRESNDVDYQEPIEMSTPTSIVSIQTSDDDPISARIQKLKEVQTLLEEGLISQEEFDAEKIKILNG